MSALPFEKSSLNLHNCLFFIFYESIYSLSDPLPPRGSLCHGFKLWHRREQEYEKELSAWQCYHGLKAIGSNEDPGGEINDGLIQIWTVGQGVWQNIQGNWHTEFGWRDGSS